MTEEVSAGGIVHRNIDGSSYWLIIQHSYRKNHWGFPKGHVGDTNPEETIEEAAVREVQEEGGVTARILAKITPPSHYIFTFRKKKIAKTVHFFLMEYVSGSPENHDDEIAQAQFIPTQKALQLLTHEDDKKQLEAALRLYNSVGAPLV